MLNSIATKEPSNDEPPIMNVEKNKRWGNSEDWSKFVNRKKRLEGKEYLSKKILMVCLRTIFQSLQRPLKTHATVF